MSNIAKKHSDSDVHSHKKAIDFLKEHLKSDYLEEAQGRLKKKGVKISDSLIYKVKVGHKKNWKVLEVLAEIALENKTAKKKVAKLINNN